MKTCSQLQLTEPRKEIGAIKAIASRPIRDIISTIVIPRTYAPNAWVGTQEISRRREIRKEILRNVQVVCICD